MIWMKNAGYDLNGMLESFHIKKRYQEKALLRKATTSLLVSKRINHPLSDERLEKTPVVLLATKEPVRLYVIVP